MWILNIVFLMRMDMKFLNVAMALAVLQRLYKPENSPLNSVLKLKQPVVLLH